MPMELKITKVRKHDERVSFVLASSFRTSLVTISLWLLHVLPTQTLYFCCSLDACDGCLGISWVFDSGCV
jgi:hypothetical protein